MTPDSPPGRSPRDSGGGPPGDSPGGPLDIATLEVMGRRASTHELVIGWSFRPDDISPRRLELRLDDGQYPDEVDAVRVDVSWYESGEYTIHYVESHGQWQCRWDRHPKPDAPAAHFHPPPDASAAVEPSPIDDSHHLGVLFDVLDRVADRISTLHES